MNARLLTAVAATGALAVLAAPAGAAPKTMKATYDVSLPVPFPVTEDIPGMHGCWNGQEDVSKDTRSITLPAPGLFKAQVDYTGDWDLYLFDAKGNILTAAESDETGNTEAATEKIVWKKAKKGQQVSLVVCNWGGLKDAKVAYTFTYGK